MALTYEQIDKKSRFINKDEAARGTGTENGGIPIGSNDIVQIQENARADNIAILEFFREHTKEINGNIGSSINLNGVEYERGLILQGGRYKKADNNGPRDIEPGKIYLHGEVVNFQGFQIGFQLGSVFWIWREKTDYVTTKRKFKDGPNKDVLKIPTYSTGFSNSANTPPAGMSATSQHIRYNYANMDTLNGTVCEEYTIQAATGLAKLKEQNGQGPLVQVGSGSTYQTFANNRYLTLRVNEDIPIVNEGDFNNVLDLSNINNFTFNGGAKETAYSVMIKLGITHYNAVGLIENGIFKVKVLEDNVGNTNQNFRYNFDLTIENDSWSGEETKQTERWMRHPDDNTEPL